jgi:hypothetical protein
MSRPSTRLGWIAALALTVIATTSGCRRDEVAVVLATSPTPAGTPAPRNRDILAWTTKKHVGILADGSPSKADFPIRNVGSRPVTLRLGSSSCTCTEVSLDREALAPGDEAVLTLGLTKSSKVGLDEGTVDVTTDVGPWNQRFSISGTALGVQFPTEQKVLNSKANLIVEGHYVASSATETIEVIPEGGDPDPAEGLWTVAEIRISDPRPIPSAFLRTIAIELMPNRQTLEALEASRLTRLQVRVVRGSDEEQYSMGIVASASAR